MRPGGEKRGSSYDRRARRAWMVREFGVETPDGLRVPCRHCGDLLALEAFEVDRFPLCGHDGGRYVRGNIVPACRVCNGGRCAACVPVLEEVEELLGRGSRY